MPDVCRGDVFFANLNPTLGSEQSGTRPVVVVSRNAINANSPVVVVLPITSANNKRKLYPSQVAVPAGAGGLVNESVVLCEQVRTISKERLQMRKGNFDSAIMAQIEAAIRITLDLA